MTAPAAFDHATSHHPFTLPVTLITGQNSLEFIRAVGTAPVWMSTPVQTLPLLAVGLWLLWPVAQRIMPMGQLESFLELPRLMAIAGYSLFKLGAVMLVGIAIGLWIANEADTAQVKRRLLTIGVAGMAFCATTIVSLERVAAVMTRFSTVFFSLPGYGFYASTMIAVMGLALGVTAVWDSAFWAARAGGDRRAGFAHLRVSRAGHPAQGYPGHSGHPKRAGTDSAPDSVSNHYGLHRTTAL